MNVPKKARESPHIGVGLSQYQEEADVYYKMKAFQDYQENQVMSAPPERLLILLLEGLNANIANAREAIETGDANRRRTNLRKGRDICTELISSLDYDIGGEIAMNLHRLYMFVNRQLVEADIKDSVKHLDDAIRILEILESGWREAVANVQAERASSLREGI